MKEELNKLLISFLNKTGEGIEKGLAFAQQQIPDLIRQLLLWELSFAVAWTVISLTSIIGGIWFCKKANQFYSKPENKYMKSDGLQYLFVGMWIVVWCIPFFINLFNGLEIVVAPKLYLLQYAASLMKGK